LSKEKENVAHEKAKDAELEDKLKSSQQQLAD
jgi:chromosome segregation ATPase